MDTEANVISTSIRVFREAGWHQNRDGSEHAPLHSQTVSRPQTRELFHIHFTEQMWQNVFTSEKKGTGDYSF